MYRRARATALPINAGVEDFKKAVADLKKVLEIQDKHDELDKEAILQLDLYESTKHIKSEITRLEKLIKVNSKREKDTYSKMFNSGKCVTD